jgi:hypothetical protein
MRKLSNNQCACFSFPFVQFWELDQDHDFMIDRNDLLRYGGHALTYRAVDRIFAGAPRRLQCAQASSHAICFVHVVHCHAACNVNRCLSGNRIDCIRCLLSNDGFLTVPRLACT